VANVPHNTRDTTSLHPFARRSESDPGAIGAGQGWFKLSTGELKVRNAADNGWVTVVDANLATHLADTSDAHDASAISFSPVGTVAATDVQAAIAEVASEAGGGGGWTAVDASETVKGIAELATQAETNTGTDDTRIVTPLKLKTNVDLHINDATDAHDASAISIADSANQYTATNAEDALAEVLDGLQAHEADTTGAHAASAIAFTPAGTIAATNMQAALEEVASEGGGGSGYKTLVTLGSDQATTSTSYSDVTGLSFAVSANTTYRFYALILFEVSAQVIGSAWSVNGPSFAGGGGFLGYKTEWAQSGTTGNLTFRNAYDTNSVSSQSATAAGNMAVIEGIVGPTSSGTFAVRFLVENTGTLTVKAGSTLEYW